MKPHNVYLELIKLSDEIDDYLKTHKDDKFFQQLNSLQETAENIGMSWSQSWLGYHSCVYYNNFCPPPHGAVFSPQLGLEPYPYINPTNGEWVAYNYSDVIEYILESSGNVNLDELGATSRTTLEFFEEKKAVVISELSIFTKKIPDDKYVNDLSDKISKTIYYSRDKLINAMVPKGNLMSSDVRAITEGIKCPPHITIKATVGALKSPYHLCKELSKITRQIASHIEKLTGDEVKIKDIGTRVFIGHGGSTLWRELKDFIYERLHLPWDEFNRVPIAGITNIARLSEMMDNAAVAFLILTAEDEKKDGKTNPRMNVVHEAGLFQGRLGFTKAIVLLEDGCEEFSNIHGLGQIRFPKNNISAVFEDIRLVLEREGLIEDPKK